MKDKLSMYIIYGKDYGKKCKKQSSSYLSATEDLLVMSQLLRKNTKQVEEN